MNEAVLRELLQKAEELVEQIKALIELLRQEREAKEGLDIHGNMI